jgi:hypothetical protein
LCVERESPVKKGKEFLFFPFALARQKAIFARPLARRLLREEILPLPRGRRSSQKNTKTNTKRKTPKRFNTARALFSLFVSLLFLKSRKKTFCLQT